MNPSIINIDYLRWPSFGYLSYLLMIVLCIIYKCDTKCFALITTIALNGFSRKYLAAD